MSLLSRSLHAAGALAASALLLSSPALAQSAGDNVPSFDLERLQLNPAGQHGLLVGGGDVLEAANYRFGVFAHYQHDPVVVYDAAGKRVVSLVGSRLTAHLTGAFSLTKWFELGLQVPVVLLQAPSGALDDFGLKAPTATALGAPWLQARAAVLRETDGAAIDLSIDLLFGLPLGNPSALSVDGDLTVIPRVGLGKRFGNVVRIAGEVGGWIRPETALTSSDGNITPARISPTFQVGLGASTVGEGARYELAARLAVPADGTVAGGEVLAGASIPVGPLNLHLLAGPGIGRLPGTPLFRVLAGLTVGTQKAKEEPKPVDVCAEGQVHTPEQCPNNDDDHDGIVNGADGCPLVAGKASAKGCPDADGDGKQDSVDQCPAEASDRESGCPDADGDGLEDRNDTCPKAAGPEKTHGCPLPDTDGDGLADEEDKCPAVAGLKELKGCLPDRDQDEVPDGKDACLETPGKIEFDGCPTAPKVKLGQDKLVVTEKVFFDTSKATIQKRSFALLDSVAQLLKDHTEVSRLFIDGHTDSVGKAEANRKLSQNRANSVKDYLVKKGVDAARLEARGFGPDRPIADNKTADGREQNRRVEFNFETATRTYEVKP